MTGPGAESVLMQEAPDIVGRLPQQRQVGLGQPG